MTTWEAPAKLNLSLFVSPPRRDGYHPIESLVQTVEWCDTLEFEEVDERADVVEIDHPDIDSENNLVVKALAAVRGRRSYPTQRVTVAKHVPVGAGLGGGSADAAAAVMAAGDLARLDRGDQAEIAVGLGADVPLFLVGGTLVMSGIGEVIEPRPPLSGLAFAVVVPEFRLATAAVYQAWDRLEGPVGEPLPERALPPSLRGGMPLRNDLLPAAVSVEPLLAEFMAEVRSRWGQPVALTGSGSACFGLFTSIDEAVDAASAVSYLCSRALGVHPRPRGVSQVDRGPRL